MAVVSRGGEELLARTQFVWIFTLSFTIRMILFLNKDFLLRKKLREITPVKKSSTTIV